MGVVIKKKKKINFVRDGCTAFQINEDFYKNILGPLSLIITSTSEKSVKGRGLLRNLLISYTMFKEQCR